MKRFLFATALFCSQLLLGQDTLVYRDGTREAVKVLKLERTSVDYLKWPVADSNRVNSKSSEIIQTVKYSDGRLVNMVYYSIPELPKPRQFMRNWVAIDIFDPFLRQLTLSYQHSFRNNITLRVPLSTSFSALSGNTRPYSRQGYYSQNKIFSTGLDLTILFNPYEANGFLGGLSYEGGLFKYVYEPYNSNYYVPGKTESINASFNGFYARGGYFLNTMKHIAFGFYTDLGVCTHLFLSQMYNATTVYYVQNKTIQFDVRLKVGIGYTF